MRASPTCTPFPAPDTKSIRHWDQTKRCDHFVQFYRTDEYLVECVSAYLAEGLWNGEVAIVIATPEHRAAIDARLSVKGVNLSPEALETRYVSLDASTLLRAFVVGGQLDRNGFKTSVGGIIEKAAASGRRIRAFGEMVALLWAEANREAAVELEDAWNRLSRDHDFRLFCAYPTSGFEGDSVALQQVCACHSRVVSLSA